MASRMSRLRHAWNAFVSKDDNPNPPALNPLNLGPSFSFKPDRARLRVYNERSIISSIYTRISIDVASVEVKHVKVDDQGRYVDDIPSGLNNCLTVSANIDQGARSFLQDAAMTLLDKGCIAIVPVDTTDDPTITGAWDVQSLRVAEVIQWFPQYVQVRCYNERKGIREDITLPKSMVAIVENPLYAVMNEQSSTLQRLIRTLSLLDTVDENASTGKLDMIIQLPYIIRTDARREEAEKRRKLVEQQLTESQYGIAYTDGTERITQLNRPVTSNLLDKVQYLTTMLYGQLGITDEIMNGTATPQTMTLYENRTIEPIIAAITQAMHRVFLTKTARSQGQAVMYMVDRFRFIPVSDLDELIDVLSRNEIAAVNDVRPILGWKPLKDPSANVPQNKNMPSDKLGPKPTAPALPPPDPSLQGESQNDT